MLKRTLVFESAWHVSVRNSNYVVKDKISGEERSVPSEDVGFAIFDNPQITFTQTVIQLMAEHNTTAVFCDDKHLPASMLHNFNGNNLTGRVTEKQLEAGEALKKQLWQQTVKAKIRNQAAVLDAVGKEGAALREIAKEVKSGDSDNREGKAAKLYWQTLFPNFTRDPDGDYPNNFLNYTYTILRAATAKALTGAGLLPVVGIAHHNKYNPFRLADDIMEPFRAYSDAIVYEAVLKFPNEQQITKEIKFKLLDILTVDTQYENVKRPLSVGLAMTAASLAQCFTGEKRKISYPSF